MALIPDELPEPLRIATMASDFIPGSKTIRRDPLIEEFKKDVDRTLLRENLRRTPLERLRRMEDYLEFAEECRAAAKARRHGGEPEP